MSNSKLNSRNRVQALETTLGLLDVVAEGESISQRGLAERLGVALGLTNAVLKRCVKKGLLKIQQAPARRYAYYLTPQGFAEKSRLTAEYLSHSLHFFRAARQEYSDIFQNCANRGWTRVILVGATDLAEIASLAVNGTDVQIVGIIDPGRNEASFSNLPIFQTVDAIQPSQRPHAVILSETVNPQDVYDSLAELMPRERVLSPRLLRIIETPPTGRRG